MNTSVIPTLVTPLAEGVHCCLTPTAAIENVSVAEFEMDRFYEIEKEGNFANPAFMAAFMRIIHLFGKVDWLLPDSTPLRGASPLPNNYPDQHMRKNAVNIFR